MSDVNLRSVAEKFFILSSALVAVLLMSDMAAASSGEYKIPQIDVQEQFRPVPIERVISAKIDSAVSLQGMKAKMVRVKVTMRVEGNLYECKLNDLATSLDTFWSGQMTPVYFRVIAKDCPNHEPLDPILTGYPSISYPAEVSAYFDVFLYRNEPRIVTVKLGFRPDDNEKAEIVVEDKNGTVSVELK